MVNDTVKFGRVGIKVRRSGDKQLEATESESLTLKRQAYMVSVTDSDGEFVKEGPEPLIEPGDFTFADSVTKRANSTPTIFSIVKSLFG